MSEAKPRLYVRCPRQLVNLMFEDLREQLPELIRVHVDPRKKGMLLFLLCKNHQFTKSGKQEYCLTLNYVDTKPTENDIVITRKSFGNLSSVITLMGYTVTELATTQ